MTAAEIIKLTRRLKRWSQKQLALAAGVPQSTIARWESGRVSPRVDSMQRVLEAAGIVAKVQLVVSDLTDLDQIRERLSWTPRQRLRYLTDMVAFEDRARSAREV